MFYQSLVLSLSSSFVLASSLVQKPVLRETVYVESPTDTDGDGKLDKIYVSISRPTGKVNVPVIYEISPYALGGNGTSFHDVNVNQLPQDEISSRQVRVKSLDRFLLEKAAKSFQLRALERGYASIKAHSLGTGYSTGCPTVGDDSETQAAKSVIDWLNGRAKAFNSSGGEVFASWASGSVGMTGVSYDGTLPNMVATTGVDGLKAIIPIAAISSWYDYYRANGLVVGPGGYVGEDADILGQFIVRSNACQREITLLGESMGREHGDFTQFWANRDYVAKASQVKAAVFIMHGQSDWNVRQSHAIKWWKSLEGVVPRRMWLHNGGHTNPSHPNFSRETWAWFDRYVKGENNGVENSGKVEVQSSGGSWGVQEDWPHEDTNRKVFYLNTNRNLSQVSGNEAQESFVDSGRDTSIEWMMNSPTDEHSGRLAFVSGVLLKPQLLSGTAKMSLTVSVQNRRAANITVAIIEYGSYGRGKVITRGWADPQNHKSLEEGELLDMGVEYQVKFDLEPKQYTFSKGKRIGVLVTSTDYYHTLRPKAGTQLSVTLGEKSFIEMDLLELDASRISKE